MYRPKDYGAPLVNDHLYQKVVCVDFDGVLCDSSGPYARTHFGNPKPEGLKTLRQLLDENYNVIILTARRETDLVMNWLKKQGFRNLLVTNHKVPAIAYIDDHAMHFKDNATADEIMQKVRKAAR
jgi:phosphoglycolate phosphatase-like HAD superfamily hydrolase